MSSTDGSYPGPGQGSFVHNHGLPYTGQYTNTVWGASSVGSSVEERGGGLAGPPGGVAGRRRS